jgi:hypothetical protein
MNILFGTFLTVTFMPAILLGIVALLGGDHNGMHRAVRVRTLPRRPCRPPRDDY